MPTVLVRPPVLYAWKGSSLLIVDANGRCGSDDPSPVAMLAVRRP